MRFAAAMLSFLIPMATAAAQTPPSAPAQPPEPPGAALLQMRAYDRTKFCIYASGFYSEGAVVAQATRQMTCSKAQGGPSSNDLSWQPMR